MRQPFTYSMPEEFIKDQNVPARWRVLAIINGFLINGGHFYGSNEWLIDQLSCSEQTVSNAFKELEEKGVVRIERTRRSRVVHRNLRDPNQLGSETQTDSSRDPNCFGTNSVSNSVSNNYSRSKAAAGKKSMKKNSFNYSETNPSDSYEDVVDIDSGEVVNTKPKSAAKYPHAKEVFSWFPNPQASWFSMKNIKEREYAEYLYKERGEEKVKHAIRFIEKHKEDPFCPTVTKPSDLERKWLDIAAYAKRNR